MLSKRKLAKRKKLRQLKSLQQKKRMTLKELQQTIVKPIGINFTSRYRLFQFNSGQIYMLDRFDNHKIVQDLTNDISISAIIRELWNNDFELYTDEVLDYVIDSKEKYWSYDYLI